VCYLTVVILRFGFLWFVMGVGIGSRDEEYFEHLDSPEVYMVPGVSEELNGSLTNEVVITLGGTVLKEFSESPGMSYVQAMGRIPAATLERQNQKDRIENEEDFREFISGYEIDVPDVLGVEDNFVEFERLDGEDLNHYVNRNHGEAENYGAEVGEFLNYVHGEGGAITDLRLNNFMVQDSGDLAFLDGEYFVDDAGIWEKEMDLITLVSSLKQVDPEPYKLFRAGFEEEYDGHTDPLVDVSSSVTSQVHARYLERDQERAENAKDNTVFRIL
jgi:tRNA A-37 threonylcarbamoyl transferase component Bud32